MATRPLDPDKVNGRQFYHYRNNWKTLVGVITMADALAAWRIENYGQELWPCEWGLKQSTTEGKK